MKHRNQQKLSTLLETNRGSCAPNLSQLKLLNFYYAEENVQLLQKVELSNQTADNHPKNLPSQFPVWKS